MTKKLYTSPDKKICGVCAGIADYFNLDPTIVRAITASVACLTAIILALIVYFIIALVMPKPPENYYQLFNNTSKRIYKSNDKKICGVCGGIAEYCNTDSTVIRLIFALVFLLFGYGLAIYIVCAVLFPQSPVSNGQYYDERQFTADGNAQYYGGQNYAGQNYNGQNYGGQTYEQPGESSEQSSENGNNF